MKNKGLQKWIESIRGKSYEEIYGAERAQLMRQSRSDLTSPNSRKTEHYCVECGATVYRGSTHCRQCHPSTMFRALYQHSLDTRHKISIANKGKCRSEEACQHISQGKKGHSTPSQVREKLRVKMKRLWQTEGYWLKQARARRMKPNKEESRLASLIAELGLPYQYVGDGQFILGGKCPDFLNVNGQKKLIEYWGDFWHRGQDPQARINFFREYGFYTLIINRSQLNNEESLAKCLIEFDRQPVA